MRLLSAGTRLFCFICATFGCYGAYLAGYLFIPNKRYWRQVTFATWARSFVYLTRVEVHVYGAAPTPPFFLVTNHTGYADVGILRALVQGVFVAKAEVRKWPLVGRIVRDMGTIFIDRSRRSAIPKAGEEILERLDNGEGVIVFPEGTSTTGQTVLPFNSSFLEFAARGSVPVSYATITYATAAGDPPASKAVCWPDGISFFAHMWGLFKLRGFSATFIFGDEPITNSDRKALAAELHRRVVQNFSAVE